MKDKDAEIQELHADITELRSVLERESLCKVEFQNNLLSLNEELSFRKKVHVEVRGQYNSQLAIQSSL